MSSRQRRTIFMAGGLLLLGWLLSMGGYWVANQSRVTPEKVAAYLEAVDLNGLTASERAKALAELAAQLNALSAEDRRHARADEAWRRWFEAMTEEEKAEFLEATLPTGFKQMLTAFEELPEEKRRQAIDRALQRLERRRAALQQGDSSPEGILSTNRPPALSPELQQKAVTLGLKAFYAESSAQTKAELAPVLEEMQRLMESGSLFRGRR